MVDYINIASLESALEATLLGSFLTERSIPHMIYAYHDPEHGPRTEQGDGWGCVCAPYSHQREIMFFLADLRKNACRPE